MYRLECPKIVEKQGKSFFNDCMHYLAILVGWNRETVQEGFAERNARSRKVVLGKIVELTRKVRKE